MLLSDPPSALSSPGLEANTVDEVKRKLRGLGLEGNFLWNSPTRVLYTWLWVSAITDEDTGKAVLEPDGGPLWPPGLFSELGPFNVSAPWETGKWRGLVFHVLP